jgi:hypothetical protein
MDDEVERVIKMTKELILTSTSGLEKAELHKDNNITLINDIFASRDLEPTQRLSLLKDVWDNYISYDNEVIPSLKDTIEKGNQLLKDLQNNT